MMRKILPLLFCFFGFQAFSQTNVKLYGFIRETHAGTVPRGTQENGNPIPSTSAANEYLIYISGPRKTRIYPSEVWINGHRYEAVTEKVPGPVSVKEQNGAKKTLVAATTGTVLRIRPQQAGPRKLSVNVQSKIAANDVVVVYKMKGKFYTAVLKKLTRLEPVFNE